MITQNISKVDIKIEKLTAKLLKVTKTITPPKNPLTTVIISDKIYKSPFEEV